MQFVSAKGDIHPFSSLPNGYPPPMAPRTADARETPISLALTAISNGEHYRTAAKRFKIPISTLHYRQNNYKNATVGRRRGLTDAEKTSIVSFLLRYASQETPLTNHHLREAICIICDHMRHEQRRSLQFNPTSISEYVIRSFRKKHRNKLSFSRPLAQENKRFHTVNAETLTHHFATLQKIVAENDIDAFRVFNLDEVGVTPDKDISGVTSLRRLLPRHGSKDMLMNEYGYKNRITLMPVVSATRGTGPLLVVVKGNRIPYRTVLRNGVAVQDTLVVNLPRGAVIATRYENGGVDRANFNSWGAKCVQYTADLTAGGRKVLLVYDAYRAHLSLEVLELFYRSSIVVYELPAHTSGKTQPLDAVTFSSFKSHLNRVSAEVTLSDRDTNVDLFVLMALIREAYYASFTREIIKAGFRCSGLWPLAPERLLSVPRPATATLEKTLTVDELQGLFQQRCAEYKDKVLGEDATLLDCGYVDTTNGCVMTANYVMELARSKRAADVAHKAEEQRKQLARASAADARLEVQLKAAQAFNSDRMRVRALLARMSVERFRVRQRPMGLRRAIARRRTAARKQRF